jgi:hypothetical protein
MASSAAQSLFQDSIRTWVGVDPPRPFQEERGRRGGRLRKRRQRHQPLPAGPWYRNLQSAGFSGGGDQIDGLEAAAAPSSTAHGAAALRVRRAADGLEQPGTARASRDLRRPPPIRKTFHP